MRQISYLRLLALLPACSTPNQNLKATAAAYEQVKAGMTREQVYALLGSPRSIRVFGQTDVARWGVPHGSHGWGTWKVTFADDKVAGVSTSHATVSFSR